MQLTQQFLVAFAALAAYPGCLSASPGSELERSGGPKASAPSGDDEISAFGDPVFVNGKRISDNEIRRFLIYGVGKNQFAYRKIDVIIEDELSQRAWKGAQDEINRIQAERKTGGKPPLSDEELKKLRQERYEGLLADVRAQTTVTPEELKKEYDRRIQEFQVKYPYLDTDAEVARAYQSVPEFRRHLEQFMHFDKVFLPVDPANWPPVTVEAFLADPLGGDLLLDDAKTSYANRLQWMKDHDLTEVPKDDDLLKQIHQQIVRDAVFKVVEFRTEANGLPDDKVLWADTNGDGKPELDLTTEDLWEEIAPLVSQRDISEAKRFLALIAAARDRMGEEGILLDGKACDDAMAAYEAKSTEQAVSVDVAATQTQQFPSLESWKAYFCLLKSYEHSIESKLATDDKGEVSPLIKQHLPTAHKVFGLGQVDAEVLLVSAFDIPQNRWKPDGWKWAREKADSIRKALDKNQAEYAAQKREKPGASEQVPDAAVFWSQMMDDNSEWWDPPPPETGRPPADIIWKKKGRFGPKYRNDLMGFMGETPFSDFVQGKTVTDIIFFDQEPNTIAGPFCGLTGYYIVKVLRRTGPSRPLSLNEPSHFERVKEDYLRVAFRDYCQEALRTADVRGVPPACGGEG